MTLASLLVVSLLVGPVRAGEIEVTRYAPLREMSLEAASVRQDMQDALLAVSVGQARMKEAREDLQAATSLGIHSEDYKVAQARYATLQKDTLTRTLDQLERSQVRLDEADKRTGEFVTRMLSSPTAFQGLVKGQLKNQRGPESTALILHMAVRKLRTRCADLYSQALVGQLEMDLQDIEETLRLLGELGTPGGGGSTTLEEAWARFNGTSSTLSPTDDGAIDDLDRMLP